MLTELYDMDYIYFFKLTTVCILRLFRENRQRPPRRLRTYKYQNAAASTNLDFFPTTHKNVN
jgi:hypothetical protein